MRCVKHCRDTLWVPMDCCQHHYTGYLMENWHSIRSRATELFGKFQDYGPFFIQKSSFIWLILSSLLPALPPSFCRIKCYGSLGSGLGIAQWYSVLSMHEALTPLSLAPQSQSTTGLGQRLTSIFCKGPGGKYFWALWATCGLRCMFSCLN
jgi:hypothetical protein